MERIKQQLFDKFEEVNLTDSFNKTFENEINKIFEDYAEMKSDDEYEVIYPTDSDGWEVVVPKTFGAAKYLSSFKGIGKAYWCTASHAESFKKYTKNDNKLYIIRNVKKSILYQMDWGYQYKWTEPSFQNFHNKQISVNTAIEKPQNKTSRLLPVRLQDKPNRPYECPMQYGLGYQQKPSTNRGRFQGR